MAKRINICVALQSEAQALIEHYRLKKLNTKVFALYQGWSEPEQSHVQLLICGIGVTRMSAAIAWLAARNEQANTDISCVDVWLNYGVIGHGEIERGTAVRVARVAGFPLKRSHYPSLVAKWKGKLVSLQTLLSASSDYPPAVGVDMEGAAFFETALWFACSELVQSIKVVSDNTEQQMRSLNAQQIRHLSGINLPSVCAFISCLLSLAQELEASVTVNDYDAQLKNFKLSYSEQRQCHAAIAHLTNLQFGVRQVRHLIESCKNTKQLLKELMALQAETAPVLAERD